MEKDARFGPSMDSGGDDPGGIYIPFSRASVGREDRSWIRQVQHHKGHRAQFQLALVSILPPQPPPPKVRLVSV